MVAVVVVAEYTALAVAGSRLVAVEQDPTREHVAQFRFAGEPETSPLVVRADSSTKYFVD